ncbi:PP0621 family protein [Orrella sp. JC864]|uniref:PP0621 family protein n=1 Tax=Orrella sp. JC864 TaxID=3120298 RepID=UPI0012BC0BAB
MGKILFWVLVIVCVLFVARLISHQSAKRMRRGETTAEPALQNDPGEPMVRCAHCGIHLPRSEALLTQGQTWCGPEHARLGARQ